MDPERFCNVLWQLGGWVMPSERARAESLACQFGSKSVLSATTGPLRLALEQKPASPGGPGTAQGVGLTPRGSDSAGLGWDPRRCFSNESR